MPSTIRTLAQESTTLPEGAQIILARCCVEHEAKRNREARLLEPHTVISAARGKLLVKMRVDDVPAHNLKPYLALCLRQIEKERNIIAEIKPEAFALLLPVIEPTNFREFAIAMAQRSMFILHPEIKNHHHDSKRKVAGPTYTTPF